MEPVKNDPTEDQVHDSEATQPGNSPELDGLKAERHRVLYEWNDTGAEYQSDKCVHESFEDQVNRSPEAAALEYEDQRLTYGDLNRRANQLAHYLRELGVRPDDRVAICVERSVEMVIGLLAILKAGGSYVPLDPVSPMDRLRFMLEDSDPRALLTQAQLGEKIGKLSSGLRVLDLMDAGAWSGQPESNPKNADVGLTPEHLAYMIYTSGSTGKPKGVLIEHRAVGNQIRALQEQWQICARDRVLQFASIAFDASVEEVFGALLSGATLVLRGQDWLVSAREFWGLLEGRAITVADLPTRFWSQMVDDRAAPISSKLRLLIIGGEAVEARALVNWFEREGYRPPLWNSYGPTETTVNATLQEVKADASTWNSIGRPIANTRVYILDGQKQPVPVGTTGELYIAGAGLARGYWNRPELTAERFLEDPFAEEAAARMYKSGDLGRWLPDGAIEFVGRNDDQVKIHGYRIELGEIEARLNEHEDVKEAAVVVSEKEDGDKRLVAYYVADGAHRNGKERETAKTEQVAAWATTYNAIISGGDHPRDDSTFNIAGWVSSYTGQPIAREEMREWLDRTVERVQSLRPKRVWEIGCGTGLLLFRIAPECTLYRGTDVSAVELNFVRQQLHRPGMQMPQVVLERKAAHESWHAEEQEKFDLIMMNSVVQYFPDLEYLMTVLTRAIEALQSGGAIFIGDVRSYPLLEAFHASVQLYQAPDSLSCDALWNRVQKKVRQEAELVVAPEFFTALPQRLPQINRVEVHLKRGQARNELTCFRYDVALHVGEPAVEAECEWLDWDQESLSLSVLKDRLSRIRSEALGITGIPNARLYRDVAAVRMLSCGQHPATVGELRVKLDNEQPTTVELEDLWGLAQELEFNIEVRPSHSAVSSCDVVFRRKEVNGKDVSHGVVKFPGESGSMRSLASYATDPLQQAVARALATELRSWLAAKLPEYMLPVAYVQMERLPLTASGKLDRKGLPKPEADAYATSGYEAPQGEMENMLAGMWAELLQVERVGRQDSFFALGGHSLQAVTLMERIGQRGFEVEAAVLFSSPTLAGLAAALKEKIKVHTVTENRIPIGAEEITPQMLPLAPLTAEEINRIVSGVKGGAPNVQDIYPLTPLQEGILFHHLMAEGTDPYLLITQMSFDTRLLLDRYLAALQKVIDRHDILRTSVVWEGLKEPLQVVWRSAHMQTEELELNGVDGDAATRMYALLDPRRNRLDVRQSPMMRAYVGYDKAKDRWLLCLLLHHLSGDHTTEELIEEEIEAQFSGQEHFLPAPLPFRNLIVQARFGMSRDEHEAFFRQMLADVVEPTAPFGLLNVQGDGTEVEEDRIMLDPALSRRLRTWARTLNVSPASLCHLAWGRVLAQVSDRSDVVFGTVLFGRMQGGLGADRVMGLCINTLPVRLQIGKESVVASARKTHSALAELMRHEHAPLVLAQRCSGVAASTPLFSSLLNCHHSKNKTQALSAEGVGVLRMEERTNYPLTLSVEDLETDFRLMAQVQGEVRARRVCQYMQATLESLVTALEANPDMPVSRLQVLPNEERRHLLYELNATEVEYPRDKCVHELFEEQVEKTPDAVAVVFEEEELSYGELNARANRLAHYLRELGVRPDDRVGICAERSLEMVVGLLAILKAGGAYVPLDPSYPAERLQYIVEDSTLVALLTQDHLRSLFQEHAGLLAIDISEGSRRREQPEANPDKSSIGLTSEHLAYVIYTSGSTGTPKGVMVQHGNVVNSTLARRSSYQNSGRFLLLSPVSFDSSVAGILGTLTNGDTLLVATQATVRDPSCLSEYIEQRQVQSLLCIPSLYQQIIEDESRYRHPQLFRVIVAGEPCPSSLVAKSARNRPHVELCNEYGPTEATVWASMHRCVVRPIEQSVPIGRPIANTRIYILDGQGEPVPVGVAGELYIGGAGVARGYQGRPALTAEKFVPDPYARAAGARMYRTGDLARWLADGTLAFLGRNDSQVKIRGFRIELGEIEARLMEHPSVREAVVMAREYAAGDKRLVAYYTSSAAADPEQEVAAEQMRRHLSASLPEYMVPAAYVRLESLPLTPNGKLDRRALPAPDSDAYSTRAYEPPQGEMETKLAQVWAEVLKLDQVGRHDNFFALGGHSLLAVTLMERMRRHGFNLNVRSLFAAPTIAALAATADSAAPDIKVPPNRILSGCEKITPEMLSLIELTQEEIDRVVQTVPGGAANVQEIYPLAPLQEGILFHHLMGGEGDPYLLASLLSFDTRERLDNYRKALQAVVDRRDTLRTAVLWEELRTPVQVVWRQAPLQVEEVKLDPAAGDVSEQLYARLDPRRFRIDVRQAPLLRLYLAYDPAQNRWLMMQLHHHLVVDHSTSEVMQAEIQAHLLGQQEKLAAPLPFRNLVAQARLGISQEEHQGFFRRMLGDVDEPTAPFGLLDVRGDGSNHEEACLALDIDLARRLRRHGRRLGTSAASLCHLAWARVVSSISGRDDVVFGTVLLGRMQGGEGADRVMGLFINTLPVRISVAEKGVEDAVRQTHGLLADLMRHEHASLALAQRCSAVPAPAPLFSSLLNYRHSPGDAQVLSAEAMQAWQGIQELRSEERTNYPLTLSVDDLGEGFSLVAETLPSVGAMRICELMRTALESLADALETAPTKPVRELDVLSKAERQRVLYEWNDTKAEYQSDKCVHELFEEQVEKTPDAIAVVFEEEELSYAELNARANRLAHYLRQLGVEAGDKVAIVLERSVDLVTAEIAILKSGASYVPIDPAFPTERIAWLVVDCTARVVFSLHKTAISEGLAATRINIDQLLLNEKDPGNLQGRFNSEAAAYIMYTSGSTGRPKGVIVPHRAISRLVLNNGYARFEGGDRVAFAANPAFDASTLEVWAPLLNGGRIVIIDQDTLLEPARFGKALKKYAVNVLWLTAGLFNRLSEELGKEFEALRYLIVGGEALDPGAIARTLRSNPPQHLLNGYGPTETTTFAATCEITVVPDNARSIPIGRPIANTQIYILDGYGEPVPIGVTGELYIGGSGVARGYLNRSELTAEKFLKDPFTDDANGRMYRTGDLGRWLPDGNIEFLGRNDFQVKIRGFRIELGEIEARLNEHAGVQEAVVLAREDTPGDKRLVAYYTSSVATDPEQEVVEAEQIRRHLSACLPEYMVPAAFVRLESLPLTPNGKLDRQALREMKTIVSPRKSLIIKAENQLQETIHKIWCNVLGIQEVSIFDNFFDVGGHSLSMIKIHVGLKKELGRTITIVDLFKYSTIASLSDFIAHGEDPQEKMIQSRDLVAVKEGRGRLNKRLVRRRTETVKQNG
jgi:amino acid adenylation domain-containing protein